MSKTPDPPPLIIELRLPPSTVDALVERIQLAVAETLHTQAGPAQLLSDQRVCIELLGCSTRTLRDVLLPAGIPHMLVGDMRRYDRNEVIEWLRSRRDIPNPVDLPTSPTQPDPNPRT